MPLPNFKRAYDLAQKYPDLFVGFILADIDRLWEAYSARRCASWLFDDRESVEVAIREWMGWTEEES